MLPTVVLLVLVASVASEEHSCPAGCECVEVTGNVRAKSLSVACSGEAVTNIPAFQETTGPLVHKLIFVDTSLTDVPVGAFGSTPNLQYLSVLNTIPLTIAESGVFEELPRLSYVDFDDSMPMQCQCSDSYQYLWDLSWQSTATVSMMCSNNGRRRQLKALSHAQLGCGNNALLENEGKYPALDDGHRLRKRRSSSSDQESAGSDSGTVHRIAGGVDALKNQLRAAFDRIGELESELRTITHTTESPTTDVSMTFTTAQEARIRDITSTAVNRLLSPVLERVAALEQARTEPSLGEAFPPSQARTAGQTASSNISSRIMRLESEVETLKTRGLNSAQLRAVQGIVAPVSTQLFQILRTSIDKINDDIAEVKLQSTALVGRVNGQEGLSQSLAQAVSILRTSSISLSRGQQAEVASAISNQTQPLSESLDALRADVANNKEQNEGALVSSISDLATLSSEVDGLLAKVTAVEGRVNRTTIVPGGSNTGSTSSVANLQNDINQLRAQVNGPLSTRQLNEVTTIATESLRPLTSTVNSLTRRQSTILNRELPGIRDVTRQLRTDLQQESETRGSADRITISRFTSLSQRVLILETTTAPPTSATTQSPTAASSNADLTAVTSRVTALETKVSSLESQANGPLNPVEMNQVRSLNALSTGRVTAEVNQLKRAQSNILNTELPSLKAQAEQLQSGLQAETDARASADELIDIRLIVLTGRIPDLDATTSTVVPTASPPTDRPTVDISGITSRVAQLEDKVSRDVANLTMKLTLVDLSVTDVSTLLPSLREDTTQLQNSLQSERVARMNADRSATNQLLVLTRRIQSLQTATVPPTAAPTTVRPTVDLSGITSRVSQLETNVNQVRGLNALSTGRLTAEINQLKRGQADILNTELPSLRENTTQLQNGLQSERVARMNADRSVTNQLLVLTRRVQSLQTATVSPSAAPTIVRPTFDLSGITARITQLETKTVRDVVNLTARVASVEMSVVDLAIETNELGQQEQNQVNDLIRVSTTTTKAQMDAILAIVSSSSRARQALQESVNDVVMQQSVATDHRESLMRTIQSNYDTLSTMLRSVESQLATTPAPPTGSAASSINETALLMMREQLAQSLRGLDRLSGESSNQRQVVSMHRMNFTQEVETLKELAANIRGQHSIDNGDLQRQIDTLESRIAELGTFGSSSVDSRLNGLDRKLTNTNSELSTLNTRVSRLSSTLDGVRRSYDRQIRDNTRRSGAAESLSRSNRQLVDQLRRGASSTVTTLANMDRKINVVTAEVRRVNDSQVTIADVRREVSEGVDPAIQSANGLISITTQLSTSATQLRSGVSRNQASVNSLERRVTQLGTTLRSELRGQVNATLVEATDRLQDKAARDAATLQDALNDMFQLIETQSSGQVRTFRDEISTAKTDLRREQAAAILLLRTASISRCTGVAKWTTSSMDVNVSVSGAPSAVLFRQPFEQHVQGAVNTTLELELTGTVQLSANANVKLLINDTPCRPAVDGLMMSVRRARSTALHLSGICATETPLSGVHQISLVVEDANQRPFNSQTGDLRNSQLVVKELC